MSNAKRTSRKQTLLPSKSATAKAAAKPAPKRKAAAPKLELEGESAPELTNKQRAFVEHYLTCWNATEAARRAGYSAKTAQEQGSRLLSNAMVDTLVKQRIGELKMTADEVLLRLAAHARGDIGELLDATGAIDLKTARRQKRLHLVKRVSNTDKGISVEMYDAQAALVQIGKTMKLFVDVQEHQGGLTVELDSAIQKGYGESPGDANSDAPKPT